MEKNFSQNQQDIIDYAHETFLEKDAVLDEAVERMKNAQLPMIQVGAFDGLHLEVLTRGFAVRRAVEIGTLGGYSAIRIARGLQPDGFLWTIDSNPTHVKIAQENIERAKLADRVKVLEGSALKVLKNLEKSGPFDLIFIDADKVNYPNYYEWAAENLRIGGALLADNTFAFGHIADQEFPDEELRISVMALREFNRRMAKGGRFRSTILPTGEGLTLGIKLR